MTKTNKTSIGTVGRGKQKLLIFEKKCKCVFVYLFIHLFISFMVSIRCILGLLEVTACTLIPNCINICNTEPHIRLYHIIYYGG